MDEKISVGLDPKQVLDSLSKMGAEFQELAQKIEATMGKQAPKSFNKLEEAAEKGTGKIAGFFHNLGQRVKEDLKTAFDMGMVLQGAKFANNLAEGTKQVFEMERAFDKLNTRLGLSSDKLQDFKRKVGQAVAGTGQQLEQVLPGVETAAARGGVKSPEQLTAIADVLGKARAITGEDTAALSDTIVEILKTQGREINAKTFGETMDALQATRKAGAFGSAAEAGTAIEAMSPFAKQLGMGTREMGGMAAVASRSGSAGTDILRQIMEKGTSIGGQEQLNAAFGVNLFKNGKLDPSAIGKIDKGRFGQYSQQVMGETTGITGASGADLSRFIDSFKNGMGEYQKTVYGVNENMTQFSVATDNLASELDQFKEKTKEAGRELTSDITAMSHHILNADFKKAAGSAGDLGRDAWKNRGVIGGALLTTAAVGALTGGSLGRLLGKIGGGDLAKGVVKGEAMKAAGVEPVYVVNAAEIGDKAGIGAAASLGGNMGKLGKMGSMLGKGAGVLGAGMAGYDIGTMIGETKLGGAVGDSIAQVIADFLTKKDFNQAKADADRAEKQYREKFQAKYGMSPDDYKKAIAEGMVEGAKQTDALKPVQYTNKSAVSGTGGMR